MAPTICSDKKRPIRSNINHMRRHARSTHLTNPASTILNYVAKGSSAAATLRIHSANSEQLEQSSSSSSTIGNNNNAATPQQQQSRQISDDIVSSSTNVDVEDNLDNSMTSNNNLDTSSTRSSSPSSTPGSSICGSPYQYSDETMDDDADDAEVHSITSGKRCNNDNANDNANDGEVDVDVNGVDIELDAGKRQQLLRSTLETVFNAPTLSDKQLIRSSAFNIHNNNNNKSVITSNNNAKSYSNMCEITNTEGLLAIAIKTIKLVKRNQMLQRRLAQLQQETSEFIQSVLANPENRHFREKMQQKGQKVEKI